MRTLTLYRIKNLPLVGIVVALSVLVGSAAGMGWSRPLMVAAALALFLILVRDIKLVTPLLVVLIPLGPKFDMAFGSLYLATAVLVIGLVAWTWRNPLLPLPFRFELSPVLVALAILGAVLGLSALQALPFLLGNPTRLLRLVQFYLYAALFMLCLQIEFSPTEIRNLLVLTLLVGVAEGLVGINQWLTRPGFFLKGTFDGQHNHFAIYAVFIALLFLGVILEARSMKTGLAALVGLGVMLFGIVFSFSRGGYAAFAAGILVFFFLPVRPGRKTALAVSASAVAALVYFAVPDYVRERAQSILVNVTGEQQGISVGLRLAMWQRAIADFLENPILGRGTWSTGMKDNFYFRILAEAGLLGFASFLGLLYTVLREEWHIIRRGIDDDIMRGVITGLLPASIACLVVYNVSGDFFGVHRFMGVVWIVLALVLRYGSIIRQTGVSHDT